MILLGSAGSFLLLPNNTKDDLKFSKDDWLNARSKSDLSVLHRMSNDLLSKLKEREWVRNEVASLIGQPDLGGDSDYMRYDLGSYAPTFFSVTSRQWLSLSFVDERLSNAEIISD